ncbi:hypothetical protein [Amycolatopsis sp. NPDC059021]|uniref:hypothetical protein n=1 Tax=Amycolatopsis sp. NPDC059021 TaxID=3346704 RepID=UPI003671AC71
MKNRKDAMISRLHGMMAVSAVAFAAPTGAPTLAVTAPAVGSSIALGATTRDVRAPLANEQWIVLAWSAARRARAAHAYKPSLITEDEAKFAQAEVDAASGDSANLSKIVFHLGNIAGAAAHAAYYISKTEPAGDVASAASAAGKVTAHVQEATRTAPDITHYRKIRCAENIAITKANKAFGSIIPALP